jgi:outer membrane murein-binding lipoprotein Lpp
MFFVGCASDPQTPARTPQNDSELEQLRAEMTRLEERLADALTERDAAQAKAEKCEERAAGSRHDEPLAALPVVKLAPTDPKSSSTTGGPESRLVVRAEGDAEGEIVMAPSVPDPVPPPNSGVRLSEDPESTAVESSSSPAGARQKGATQKSP